MKFFAGIDSDIDLYPAKYPDVIACQGALDVARHALEPAQQAWKDYHAEHADQPMSVPFSRTKQRLYEVVTDTAEALAEAESAYTIALEVATARATAAWDDIIRQQFLDDLPTVEGFISLLQKHEERVAEAEEAGARHVLHVPHVFITSTELRTRLEYAKGQMNLS